MPTPTSLQQGPHPSSLSSFFLGRSPAPGLLQSPSLLPSGQKFWACQWLGCLFPSSLGDGRVCGGVIDQHTLLVQLAKWLWIHLGVPGWASPPGLRVWDRWGAHRYPVVPSILVTMGSTLADAPHTQEVGTPMAASLCCSRNASEGTERGSQLDWVTLPPNRASVGIHTLLPRMYAQPGRHGWEWYWPPRQLSVMETASPPCLTACSVAWLHVAPASSSLHSLKHKTASLSTTSSHPVSSV